MAGTSTRGAQCALQGRRAARWSTTLKKNLALVVAATAVASTISCADAPRSAPAARHAATAIVRIRPGTGLLRPAPGVMEPAGDYERFKRTQAELVKTDVVLRAALVSDFSRQLPSVKRQTDPVTWLRDSLSITFPNDAELMCIALSGDDPEELPLLVNAVVVAYLREVVDAERSARVERLSQLDKAYTQTEAELRDTMNVFRVLASGLGTGDEEPRARRRHILLANHMEKQREVARFREEAHRIEIERDVQRRMLARIEAAPPDDAKIEEETAEPRAALPAAAVRRDLPAKEEETARLDARIARLAEMIRQLEAELGAEEDVMQRYDLEPIDMTLLRMGIEQQGKTLAEIGAEMERLRVELRAPPCATLVQPASAAAARK